MLNHIHKKGIFTNEDDAEVIIDLLDKQKRYKIIPKFFSGLKGNMTKTNVSFF